MFRQKFQLNENFIRIDTTEIDTIDIISLEIPQHFAKRSHSCQYIAALC
jgi:hypothetical protein